MKSGSVLKCVGLGKSFSGNQVLQDVDVDLRPGEIHAFVGENGAGKSTLAKLVAGVYRPNQGHVEYGGKTLKLNSPRDGLENGIAMIHQEPHVFPDLSVAENIFMGHQPLQGWPRRIDWQALNAKASELLTALGSTLSPRLKVDQLSIADRQMIEVATALSHNSKIIIFDETSAALTGEEAARLFAIMRELAEKGAAIAFIGHRLEEIFAYCDRLTVLRDGIKVAEKARSETSIDEVLKLMVGRDIEGSYDHGIQSAQTEIILEVENLSNLYLHDISFKIRRGEILGLGGLVGSGRSRIARALYGIDSIDSGAVRLRGKPFNLQSPEEAIKHGLALVPEDRNRHGIMPNLNLIANTTISSLDSNSRFGFLSGKQERKHIATWIERVQVRCQNVRQPIEELSGGNAQKLILSRALLTHPELLILDEPTRGIDVGAKIEVHREIAELAEQGMAVLMISSELPELMAISDRVLVIREGSIAREFNKDSIDAEAIIAAATGQESPRRA